jgi:serine/threonine protein kinase
LDARIFTYALGDDAERVTLKQIACENKGIFTPIDDSADGELSPQHYELRTIMGNYYLYFASAVTDAGPVWSEPFVDCCGMGLITTVAHAFYHDVDGIQTFLGVVASTVPLSVLADPGALLESGHSCYTVSLTEYDLELLRGEHRCGLWWWEWLLIALAIWIPLSVGVAVGASIDHRREYRRVHRLAEPPRWHFVAIAAALVSLVGIVPLIFVFCRRRSNPELSDVGLEQPPSQSEPEFSSDGGSSTSSAESTDGAADYREKKKTTKRFSSSDSASSAETSSETNSETPSGESVGEYSTVSPRPASRGSYMSFSELQLPVVTGAEEHVEPLRGVKVGKLIGQGEFGNVYKGQKSGHTVAIKAIAGASLRVEFRILETLNHPCIVRCFGLIRLSPLLGDSLALVLEYCQHGSLDNALHENDFQLRQLLHMAYQVASGVEYLASCDIIHRDLAARNVLLDQNFNCKVSDFGLSRQMEATDNIYQVHSEVPVRWSAPEVLREMQASYASDVYSLGIVFWELFTECALPYGEHRTSTGVAGAVILGQRPPKPVAMPPRMFEITQACWQPSEQRRPPAARVASAIQDLIEGVEGGVDVWDADHDLPSPSFGDSMEMGNSVEDMAFAYSDHSGLIDPHYNVAAALANLAPSLSMSASFMLPDPDEDKTVGTRGHNQDSTNMPPSLFVGSPGEARFVGGPGEAHQEAHKVG